MGKKTRETNRQDLACGLVVVLLNLPKATFASFWNVCGTTRKRAS
jgi:hypothetical protein